MNKDFNSVKMMREIRNKLSEKYRDGRKEELELLLIRKKYGLGK